MVTNVHERELPAPAAEVGQLLDRVGRPGDPLWPSPTWVPMRLDRPLGVGADGGHGPVRYHVTRYQPGRLIEFTFRAETGLLGTHTLEVEDRGPGRCLLRHRLVARPVGTMRLLWPAMVRPCHDAVLEHLLDNAERAVTGRVAHPAGYPLRARLTLALKGARVRGVPIPKGATLVREAGRLLGAAAPGATTSGVTASRATASGATTSGVTASRATTTPRRPGAGAVSARADGRPLDLADAFAVRVPPGTSSDPQDWADLLFRDPPRAVKALLRLRDAVVTPLGIERSNSSMFDTTVRTDREALLGVDAGHLDFRAGVLVEPDTDGTTVTLSTVAATRSRAGRLYLAPVRLVHPAVVRAMLRHAARAAVAPDRPPATP
jgi:hypothetical protein